MNVLLDTATWINKPPNKLPAVRPIDVKGGDHKWKVTHRKGYIQAPGR